MDVRSIYTSKKFHQVVIFIGILLVTLVVFGLGVSVGYHKATFQYRWGENYHRSFGGPRTGFVAPLRRDMSETPHGTFGKIIKVDLPTIVVSNNEGGNEKLVRIGTSTTFRGAQENLTAKDLKVNDYVVIIGEANDQSEIEAQFIRVVPPPEEIMMRNEVRIRL